MLREMRNRISVLALVLGVFLAAPAHALTCGQVVTGTVTLTQDLDCPDTSGLIINSSNVTINLNGHMIRCHSAQGYFGSCQAPNVGQAIGDVGINVFPPGCCPSTSILENVVIRGPGLINGFMWGIQVESAAGVVIEGITITGPNDPYPPSLVNPGRSFAAGINLGSIHCNPLAPQTGPSVAVVGNDISNQVFGIWMNDITCGTVRDNHIHDNSGSHKHWFVYGILMQESAQNTIYGNQVLRNGNNVDENNWPGNWMGNFPDFDAGISVRGGAARQNQILANIVDGNCGDGIQFHVGANKNLVSGNTMLGNPSSTYGNRCFVLPAGTVFDAAERWPGVVNNWMKNNTCHTQSPGVPAGVCQ